MSMRALLITATLLGVAACGGDTETGEKSQAGPILRSAPPFALQTLDGDSVSLADFDQTPTILMNFWASWCGPCKAEIPDLIALHEEYREEGFAVLGVTVNDLPRDSRAFAETMGMTYQTVIGTPAMLEDYRLSPWLPTTLLIVEGEIVKEWVGPRVRADFEYPIRVALGRAPPIAEMLEDIRVGDEEES